MSTKAEEELAEMLADAKVFEAAEVLSTAETGPLVWDRDMPEIPAGSGVEMWKRWVKGEFPPPQCHGEPMVFRHGWSRNRRAWAAWMCTARRPGCEPTWAPSALAWGLVTQAKSSTTEESA